MSDREEFEKWWRETKGTDIPYTGLASFTEDVMFSAWQARGELDDVKIKELQDKLDKARDGDCCTEGCIKCDARKVLAETQEPVVYVCIDFDVKEISNIISVEF